MICGVVLTPGRAGGCRGSEARGDLFSNSHELRYDGAQSSRTVAEGLLHSWAKLAERAVIFDQFEERVVAEAAGAGGLEANSTAADVVALCTNRAGRIGDCDMAHIVGRSLFERGIG